MVNPREEFEAVALAAMKPGPMPAHVELETEGGGKDLLLYGDGPGFRAGGVVIIPPGLLPIRPE